MGAGVKLYHEREGVTLYHGDATDVATVLAPGSVQTVVTSPPYWGLRDYGVEGQLGAEPDVLDYIANLVVLLGEVRKVMADDGVLWLNLGDTYNAYNNNRVSGAGSLKQAAHTPAGRRGLSTDLVPNKSLIGVPWRVVLALVDDGWVLRNDVIWHKPNPMPSSVRDRLTNSHEHIFMLTKKPRYYYDADAIAEPAQDWTGRGPSTGIKRTEHYLSNNGGNAGLAGIAQRYKDGEVRPTRNARDVWTMTTRPFKGAHFATFTPELPRRCILASSRPAGKRCDCDEVIGTPLGEGGGEDNSLTVGRAGMSRERSKGEGRRLITRREQRGHAEQIKASPHRAAMAAAAGPAIDHYTRTDRVGARPLPPALLEDFTARGWLTEVAPCEHPIVEGDLVLDPFSGSGTTGMVALEHGRRYVGIDMSAEYLDLSIATRLKAVPDDAA